MRLAIVGAGYTAREHARAFNDIDDVEVTGIFSRTRNRAEQLAQELGIPKVCGSVDELFQQTQADLVVVGVPEMDMSRVAKECFGHKWSILLEKPPGYDLADAEGLGEAARRAEATVFVGLNRRFLSATAAVKDRLGSQRGPRFILVQDQQSMEQARKLKAPEEVVQRWMFANSIHTVDYLRVFGRGAITGVDAIVPWDRASPSHVVSKVSFSSGDVGIYHGVWNGPGPWAVSVSVPGWRWEMRPLERATEQGSGAGPMELDTHVWDKEFKPGFRAQAEAVVRAIRAQASATTLDDALETVRLIERIYDLE